MKKIQKERYRATNEFSRMIVNALVTRLHRQLVNIDVMYAEPGKPKTKFHREFTSSDERVKWNVKGRGARPVLKVVGYDLVERCFWWNGEHGDNCVVEFDDAAWCDLNFGGALSWFTNTCENPVFAAFQALAKEREAATSMEVESPVRRIHFSKDMEILGGILVLWCDGHQLPEDVRDWLVNNHPKVAHGFDDAVARNPYPVGSVSFTYVGHGKIVAIANKGVDDSGFQEVMTKVRAHAKVDGLAIYVLAPPKKE